MDQDLKAISALLGDKPFLFGDQPYEVDATVFGMLDIILYHKGAMPQLEALVGLQGHTGRSGVLAMESGKQGNTG